MSTEEARMDPAGGPAPETSSATGTGTSTTDTGTGAKTTEAILAEELREFGKQIEAMFHTARTSSRGKEIENQLTAAWRDVEKGVNSAITKAQSSDIKGTVQGTAQYAADEIQSGLARGLKNLNQWLAQKRVETEERRKAREAAAAAGGKMADDDIEDRFSGSSEPVFGEGLNVPAVPVEIKPGSKPADGDNPIADRFDNNPPTV